MKTDRCPECQVVLSNTSRCVCGWKEELALTTADYRCHYHVNHQRCPLAGTLVEGLKSNHWLCRAHYSARHDPALGEAVLRDIQQHFSQWSTPQKDWRVLLLEEKLKNYPASYSGRKKTIAEHLQDLKKHLLKD